MTVIILREVLKEIEVLFRLSDKKAVLVSKLKEAKAHSNQSFNYSQSSLSGSTSAAQSTQEVSSDQEITDVNNLKFSPSSPRLKISRLRPNDYRHGEQHFQTIIYHNLRIEPLFTRVVPNQSLWSKSDYFCAAGLFFTSCFLCNLFCLFFFLNTIN